MSHDHILSHDICKVVGEAHIVTLVTILAESDELHLTCELHVIHSEEIVILCCECRSLRGIECEEFILDEGVIGKNDKAIIRDFFKKEVEPRFGTKYDDYEEYVNECISIIEEAKEDLEEAVEDVKEEIAELVEDEDHDEDDYEDEFLSLEELLVCIVTENLYILIWPKPYYILDRRCFEEGKDAEFRAFIEEHARIIEA